MGRFFVKIKRYARKASPKSHDFWYRWPPHISDRWKPRARIMESAFHGHAERCKAYIPFNAERGGVSNGGRGIHLSSQHSSARSKRL